MACFRLAREFGVWDVNLMMKKMPSRLLAEWMAFFSIEADELKNKDLATQAQMGLEQMMRRRKSKQ